MSYFMGSASQYSQVQVDEQKIKLAEVQFNATAQTFNNLLKKCEDKCLNHEYGEGELTTGEASCVDRCVAKFVRANYIVGTNFQEQRINPYNTMNQYKKIQQVLDDNVKP